MCSCPTKNRFAHFLPASRNLALDFAPYLREDQGVSVNAKELIVLLDEVGAEIGRCGNNINQLAKYANILRKRGIPSPVVIERFNILFTQYLKNQQALDASLRRVFRMAGN
jgi:hypothetical protein